MQFSTTPCDLASYHSDLAHAVPATQLLSLTLDLWGIHISFFLYMELFLLRCAQLTPSLCSNLCSERPSQTALWKTVAFLLSTPLPS